MHILIVLILAGVAAWGARQSRRGIAWGRPLTAGSALAAVAIAIIQLIPDNPPPEVMEARVEQLAYAAGAGLGVHLGETYPQARVRVLQRPGGRGLSPDAMAEGLEATLRDNAQRIERIRIRGEQAAIDNEGRAEAAEGETTLKEALQGMDGEIDLLVFLFPPPRELLKNWKPGTVGRPALAVACNDAIPLLEFIEHGDIVAAVATRPNAKTHENGRLIEPPSNPLKAFSRLFQILTPETVGAFKAQFPHLVPRR